VDLMALAVGSGLTAVGVLGLRDQDRWGRLYQRLLDDMPRFYRDSNPWNGTQRELSTRLSVIWIAGGAVFILGWVAMVLW
jgi:hypothetical protein